MRWWIWISSWIASGGVVVGAAAPASDTVALSGRAMGTVWTVKYVPPINAPDAREVERQIAARLEELEQVFSTYRPASELSRFNASTSLEWQVVSPELARVASESRRISELTGGAFDATVEPLVRLWGFGAQRRAGPLPTEHEIAAARTRVGWRALEVRLEDSALRKTHADLAADFSSMAKGFASDAVAALLETLGAPNHFVQVGGDIRTGGRGGENAWRAGIEEPIVEAHRIARVVALSGEALSTSGDYRNFFVVDGRRYGHVIDPRTGWPVNALASPSRGDSTLAAVSVVHATCAQSSAWATALFVLGVEDGWRVATRERLACLFFVREGERIVPRATPEFERFDWSRVSR